MGASRFKRVYKTTGPRTEAGFTDLRYLVGSRIRSFRKLKGIQQSELARALNLSLGFMNGVELGRIMPSQLSLEIFAKFFGCDTLDFFSPLESSSSQLDSVAKSMADLSFRVERLESRVYHGSLSSLNTIADFPVQEVLQ